jgi:hypothetical protein
MKDSARTVRELNCFACGVSESELPRGQVMRRGVVVRNDPSVRNGSEDFHTLCPECDEGFETAQLSPHLTAQQLVQELRRLPVAEQKKVLDCLLKKYPEYTGK